MTGQAGRGHSMAKMVTGWVASPRLHHMSLLAHTHCGWDGTGSQLAAQCIQQVRSRASPLCLCLLGGPARWPQHLDPPSVFVCP